MYMLDTNMVSAIVTRRSEKALEIFGACRRDELCVSVITVGEMLFGIAKAPEARKLNDVISAFLDMVPALAWTAETAAIYGKVRAETEKMGRPLGALDMLIAAQAMAANAVLVTADRAFAQVPGLRVENWAA